MELEGIVTTSELFEKLVGTKSHFCQVIVRNLDLDPRCYLHFICMFFLSCQFKTNLSGLLESGRFLVDGLMNDDVCLASFERF